MSSARPNKPESQRTQKRTNPQPRNKSKNKLYNPLWCIAFCFILFSHILYMRTDPIRTDPKNQSDPHMENSEFGIQQHKSGPFKYSPSSFYSILCS